MTNHNIAKQAQFDLRLFAWREDLAAAKLRGQVKAAQYVAGEEAQITAPVADLRALPNDEAVLQTQLLYGEPFCIYEEKNGWAWGQAGLDDYVGYLRADYLTPLSQQAQSAPPDHQIATLASFIYPKQDIKARPLMALSMGARVKLTEKTERFAYVDRLGWVIASHVRPLNMKQANEPAQKTNEPIADYMAAAMQFLDSPYLWGGRSHLGLDCSALVQLALMQAGFACPRDTDMQENALGRAVLSDDLQHDDLQHEYLQRGDLVFWKGHVGLLQSPTQLLHANATYMKTIIEDFTTARKRIAKIQGDISSIRRLID
ncbi:MAG: NlpC/P60 family protein [Alphaproteobacteria bacterium]|nr:NlpC/P60 family protein [Alphaproteobacteria bacterium]